MSNFQPISIPRNPEGKKIDPEETSCYMCSEPLLLHFSAPGPVPAQIATPGPAPRTTELLALSDRDSERVLMGLSGAELRDLVPELNVGNVFFVIVGPSLLAL